MNIKIIKISDKRDHTKEIVILQVSALTNLNEYFLVDQTYDSLEGLSNKDRNIYFFPKQELIKGDYVHLYSRKGENGFSPIKTILGGRIYNCFWNMEKSVWNNTGDKATLGHIDNTHTILVNK